MPRQPCEPITIRSHCLRAAVSTMMSNGWSPKTASPSQATPAASALAFTSAR